VHPECSNDRIKSETLAVMGKSSAANASGHKSRGSNTSHLALEVVEQSVIATLVRDMQLLSSRKEGVGHTKTVAKTQSLSKT